MATCVRCGQELRPDIGFCPACGRPRILESLVAPRPKPAWHRSALRVAGGVLAIWFVATVAVAFLRAPKAVRSARVAIEGQDYREAYRALAPYLERSPEDAEALFLMGTAAINLGDLAEAGDCHTRLARLSAVQAEHLAESYRELLAAEVGSLGCDPPGLRRLHEAASELGNGFSQSVVDAVPRALELCLAEGEERQAARLVEWSQSVGGVSLDAMDSAILAPLRSALANGDYRRAQALALQAEAVSDEAAQEVDRLLQPERAKIAATVELVRNLGSAMRSNRNYAVGRFRCFPEENPAEFAAAGGSKDSWGNSIHYRPLALDQTILCYQGFELASYGSDGQPTAEEQAVGPATDIILTYVRGNESWKRPASVWLPEM